MVFTDERPENDGYHCCIVNSHQHCIWYPSGTDKDLWPWWMEMGRDLVAVYTEFFGVPKPAVDIIFYGKGNKIGVCVFTISLLPRP